MSSIKITTNGGEELIYHHARVEKGRYGEVEIYGEKGELLAKFTNQDSNNKDGLRSLVTYDDPRP